LKLRRILATSDGTDVALRGITVAATIASDHQAELLLVIAVPVSQHVAMAAKSAGRGIEGYVEHMASQALGRSVAVLKEMKVGAMIKVVIGNAAECVVAEAAASRAELVVMGRSSRVEPKDYVLGSVSDRVVRNVSVPVLLIP
jgi:nucleotide-binding universal stress UspA family protein